MPLRALIFDVDGTLAETEEAHRRAFNEAFLSAGLEWVWDAELYEELLRTTGGKERIVAYQERSIPQARHLSSDDIIALHGEKTKRYTALLAEKRVGLRPGVDRLIGEARSRGLQLAIATTTSHPNVEALCRCCWGKPVRDCFGVVSAGDEVSEKKPDPEVYHLALDRLGLDADDCLAFEDSRNGLNAAKAAGLRVVATPSRYTLNEDLSTADWVIPDLENFQLPTG